MGQLVVYDSDAANRAAHVSVLLRHIARLIDAHLKGKEYLATLTAHGDMFTYPISDQATPPYGAIICADPYVAEILQNLLPKIGAPHIIHVHSGQTHVYRGGSHGDIQVTELTIHFAPL